MGFSQVSAIRVVPHSTPQLLVGPSRRRYLLGDGPWCHALLLLQPLQQEQHVVGELVPLPPHPTKLHRPQAGVGGLVLVRAAELVQEEPGAVRVHLH